VVHVVCCFLLIQSLVLSLVWELPISHLIIRSQKVLVLGRSIQGQWLNCSADPSPNVPPGAAHARHHYAQLMSLARSSLASPPVNIAQ